MEQIKPGQIWEHSKSGNRYRIICVSVDSEYKEGGEKKKWVTYEALYNNPVSRFWTRPLAMFLEEVEIKGQKVPRYKKISD